MPKRSTDFKANQREEILNAARRCFVQQGYDRTTMREIAEEAHLSTGAIYTYFQTKAMILTAICQEQARQQQAALDHTLTAPVSDDSPFVAFFATALAPFLAVPATEVRQRELIDLLFWYEAAREPALGKLMQDLMSSWHESIRHRLEQEGTAGHIHPDLDLDAIATILIALPFGLVLYDLLRDTSLDRTTWTQTLGVLFDRAVMRPA